MLGKRFLACAAALALAFIGLFGLRSSVTASETLVVDELRFSDSVASQLRESFYDQIEAKYAPGEWAPLRMELGDAELALMGLPSKQTLLSTDLSRPIAFPAAKGGGGGGGGDPQPEPAAGPGVVAVAGAGYSGIRPGALLLFVSDNSIGWCTAAHVYGSPGAYSISTAGHCGKVGDPVFMLGAVGGEIPVLLPIGSFTKSTDGGLGNDWGMIGISSTYQNLVTPTMAFWGGPKGVFTKTGAVASVTVPNRLPAMPGITVNPDPFLAQQIVHYGHGTAIGTGGTPRSGTAIAWGSTHFMFFGALSPGDSGSGSNTLGGDTAGAVLEAAGINTHIYVDPLMRQGLGIMGGTRTTVVGTPVNGEYVGNPTHLPVLP